MHGSMSAAGGNQASRQARAAPAPPADPTANDCGPVPRLMRCAGRSERACPPVLLTRGEAEEAIRRPTRPVNDVLGQTLWRRLCRRWLVVVIWGRPRSSVGSYARVVPVSEPRIRITLPCADCDGSGKRQPEAYAGGAQVIGPGGRELTCHGCNGSGANEIDATMATLREYLEQYGGLKPS